MATSGAFNKITGAWVAPSATGTSGITSADSAWIGIGGVTTGDLIQVGTDNTVEPDGQLFSSAFYELLPGAAITIPGVTITPGDSISASLIENSSSHWTINLTDNTKSQTFTDSVSYDSSNSSAEWIEEDPSYTNTRLVPLDFFSTASFTDGSTVQNGSSVNILGSNPASITMVNSSNKPVATPSGIGSDGASFSVTRNN